MHTHFEALPRFPRFLGRFQPSLPEFRPLRLTKHKPF